MIILTRKSVQLLIRIFKTVSIANIGKKSKNNVIFVHFFCPNLHFKFQEITFYRYLLKIMYRFVQRVRRSTFKFPGKVII